METVKEETTDDADAVLMLRLKTGDTEAFDRLFERHARAVVNFTYRFVRNRAIAEDLAQEVFLRVYESASSYEVKARFTTWLYRIATNVCLNELRRPHSRLERNCGESPWMLGEGIRAPDSLERVEVAHALRGALAQLPEKQRIAFILNKYQELSYAEVAEVMRISDKAVKSLIHRAKETLARKLAPLLSECTNI